MSRPAPDPTAIQSTVESWDALVRDLFAAIVSQPFPVKEYANLAAFPSAGSFDRCLACAVDTNKLYFSKAGAWKEVTVAA